MTLTAANLAARFSIQRDSELLRLRIVSAQRAEYLRRRWFTWMAA